MDQPAAKDLYPATFSRVAAAYKRRLDEVMARGQARGRTAVLDWIDASSGKRILDLACGPGTLSYPLAKAVSPDGDVVGIDLATGMIELAKLGAPPGLPLKFELIVGSDGRGEGFSGPGNVTFDSPSAVDPWHRLPVRRMVGAAWGRYNFVLPYGRIIKRYDVGRMAEPVELAPKARDQLVTRRIVENEASFVTIAKQAGFSVAEVVRYEESTTWASPQHFIDMSAGWWSMAIRLDRVSPGERASLLERATRAIEAELGLGPLQIAGATNVLRTIA